MTTPCTVCGLPGEPLKAERAIFEDDEAERVTRIRYEPAASPGAACSPECATFVYGLHVDETPDERRLTLWRWRQRRAEARGEPFTESAPMDEAERAMVLWEARFKSALGLPLDMRLSAADLRGHIEAQRAGVESPLRMREPGDES